MTYADKKNFSETKKNDTSIRHPILHNILDQRYSNSIQLKQQEMMQSAALNKSQLQSVLNDKSIQQFYKNGSFHRQDKGTIVTNKSANKIIQCKCSICGKQGHNKNNQKFHPKSKSMVIKRKKSAEIFKKHKRRLQGGKFVKTIVCNGKKPGNCKVYVYFNEKLAGGKYGVPYFQHIAREMAAHYDGANSLITSNLETAEIGSSTHHSTRSGGYARDQYVKKFGSTVGMPKNKSGTPDIRAIAELCNPTPHGLVDHHGNVPTQDVDESVSRVYGGSVTDQNQRFRNSTANSLCGSADTAIFADAKKNGYSNTNVEKFKFRIADDFSSI